MTSRYRGLLMERMLVPPLTGLDTQDHSPAAVTHRDEKPRAPGGARAGDYGGGAHPARAVLAIMSGLPSVLQRSEVA